MPVATNIAAAHGFNPVQSAEHWVEFANTDGDRIILGAPANPQVSVDIACHLTTQAHQHAGTPPSR